jgi:hypothetical protein
MIIFFFSFFLSNSFCTSGDIEFLIKHIMDTSLKANGTIKIKQKQRRRMLSALMEVCNGAVERMNRDTDSSLRPKNSEGVVKTKDPNVCRSMLCDSNGNFVAEMIYRCLVCSAVHEYVSDAQSHYYQVHCQDQVPITQRPTSEEEVDEGSDHDADADYEMIDGKRSDALSSEPDLDEIDFNIKSNETHHSPDNRSFGRTLPVSDNHRVHTSTNQCGRLTLNGLDSRLSNDSGTFSAPLLMADESLDDARSSRASSGATTPLEDKGNSQL